MTSTKEMGLIVVSILIVLLAAGQLLAFSERQELTLEQVREEIQVNGFSWVAEENEISRLPAQERERLLGLRLPEDYQARLEEIRNRKPSQAPLQLPSRFDWTDSAGVSPVRRQLCGDCWAQCSVGAMESKRRIFDGDDTRLSVQQAIACNYGGSDCGGGWMSDVYDMYRVVGGVTESCFPYQGDNSNCDQDPCEFIMQADAWEYIDTTVTSIKTHVMTNGPIAVGMTVHSDFNYYGGGCYEHVGSGTVNHGILIVGWDDSKCSGAGAWHIKNSWGTYWGESGYAWMKYGTAEVGTGAAIVHYTPQNRARLLIDSFVIDDSSGDNDDKPDAGETITLPVSLRNAGWEDASGISATLTTDTPGIFISNGSATFPDIASGEVQQSDPPHFEFMVLSSVFCGVRIHFVISVDSDHGISTDTFQMLVGDAQTILSDDVESDLGWTTAALDDDGTDGAWKILNPRGSFLDSMLVQPELDHTPGPAVMAFVTANTKRSFHPDYKDVDGGKQTLTTPRLDLSGYASAQLRYWKWYTNDTGGPADDVWQVDASGDSGATWVNLETETASQREWIPSEYELGQYVALTDQVLVRFVASDYYDSSTVEAAVDDIEITGCPYWVDVQPPVLEVISPNGGEEITEDTDFEVTWLGDDDYGIRDFVVVASYDGGVSFPDTLGVVGGFDRSLVWHLPTGAQPDCRIGIQAVDRGYNTVFDQSDSSFSIVRDLSGVADGVQQDLPDEVRLLGSEKNPFTGSTHIFFALPRRMDVRVCIYDAEGRRVRQILNASQGAGYHSTLWDGLADAGAPVAPGVYFIRLDAGQVSCTAKAVLAR